MMIVVLMDSFKGSITSAEAGNAVKEGILAVDKAARIAVYPFADGGEGTLEAFLSADKDSRKIKVNVSDPRGRRTEAYYGVLRDDMAVIEIAQAAGLCLLSDEERDPLHTTTKGVGELIKHAISEGCRKFIIALGGSATNDCGIGMLKELGFEINNDKGFPVDDGAMGLSKAVTVRDNNVIPHLKECSFTIACDVKNPLYGKNGASHVFAPQKGALPEDIEKMDKWMEDFSDMVRESYPNAEPFSEGAGAAGGLGFAFRTFLNGHMEPGAEVLLKRTGIEEQISKADLIITGEGRIDEQTCMGKVPIRIAEIAKKYGKPVIAIAGCVGKGYEKCHESGIDVIFPTVSRPMRIQEAMGKETAKENVKRTAYEIARLIKMGTAETVQNQRPLDVVDPFARQANALPAEL